MKDGTTPVIPPRAYLFARGVLRKSGAGGRSTSYELNDLPEQMRFRNCLGSPRAGTAPCRAQSP